MVHFTSKQWITLSVMYVTIMSIFIPVGIMLPFYPVLAMSKGVMPVHFGLVFGVFRLTMCLGSPLLGKLINHIGSRFMFSSGVMLVGGCSVLMGIIRYIVGTSAFLYASYAIQSIAGLGTVMAAIASTTLINEEFPDDMGSVFGGVEISVGLGQSLGPVMGGALFQYHGITLPFVLIGCIILLVAVMDVLLLPGQPERNSVGPEPSNKVTILSILKLPIIIIFITSLMTVCLAYGFFMGTYEVHLEPLKLTSFQISAMFSINSATFCVSSWFAGWVSDKYLSPMTVSLGGSMLTVISFILLGPAPFLGIPYNIPVAVIANILFGIGNGTQVVASFNGMNRSTVASGLPDNLTTHGLVCGLWNFCFSLGCFLGFILGGGMVQVLGYPWASVLVVVMEFLVVNIILFCFSNIRHPIESTNDETETLLLSNRENSSCAKNKERTPRNSLSMGYSFNYGSVHKRTSIKGEV